MLIEMVEEVLALVSASLACICVRYVNYSFCLLDACAELKKISSTWQNDSILELTVLPACRFEFMFMSCLLCLLTQWAIRADVALTDASYS